MFDGAENESSGSSRDCERAGLADIGAVLCPAGNDVSCRERQWEERNG
jgi:hypothetical protein